MKKFLTILIAPLVVFAVCGIAACTQVPPPAPENLQWDKENWTISWDEAENAASYKLYTNESEEIFETTQTEYDFEHILTTESINTISVCAVNSKGETSDWVQLQVETETPTAALVYTMMDDGLGYEVTRMYSDFTGLEGRVVIADYYDGLPVKSIAGGAFRIVSFGTKIYNTVTTSFHLPKFLESIGTAAFSLCTMIEEITFPDSVTSIEGSVFLSCTKLKQINNFPFAITDISDNLFSSTAIERFIFSENVITIGESVFCNCASLTEVVISDSVIEIGNSAFMGCIGLTEIIIPDSVKIIGGSAFNGCKNLTQIIIPDSVNEVGDCAFYKCTNISSVSISANITVWGYDVFSGTLWFDAQTDDYVIIGDGILYKYQGNDAVINELPSEVKAIAGGAFQRNTTLTSVNIANVQLLGTNVFRSCSALKSIKIDTQTIPDYTFANCEQLTDVEFSENLESICYSAFMYCNALASIIIPDRVTYIDWTAFNSCSALTAVYYNGTPDEWNNIEINMESIGMLVLTEDKIYFYSEAEPDLNGDGTAYDGNYWHYDENGKPVAWAL